MIAALAFLLGPGCSDAPDGLPHAIRQIRAADSRSTIDISPTVARFIPLGSTTDERLAFLRREGFRVSDIPERRHWEHDGGDRAYFTTRDDGWAFLGRNIRWCLFSRDEWRIIVYSDHGKVVAVHGYIFFHSL